MFEGKAVTRTTSRTIFSTPVVPGGSRGGGKTEHSVQWEGPGGC